MLQRKDLNFKTALVTGAGSGIGRAIALRLNEDGMNVILVGRRLDKLEATAQAGTYPERMRCVASDLTQKGAIDALIGDLPELDVLVNNAGMTQNTPFEEVSEELFDKVMAINVRVPYMLCQRALPLLRKSGMGTIINIASVTAHNGYPHQSVYGASKHALLGFSKALAKEVYQDGVRVHVISPGGVYTEMIGIARPDLTPDGMIVPEEIAESVALLLEFRGNGIVDEIRVHRQGKEPFL